MQTILILMALCALLFAMLLPVAFGVWKGTVTGKTHCSRARQIRAFFNWLFLPLAWVMNQFASWTHRVPGGSVALANELANINEHGVESQLIDPASSNLPVTSRYLLYKRGATGTGYVDICGAADCPLGPSADSPYQVGDIVGIRRLGAHKGLEIGIPATAFTVDDLVLTAASGKVQTFASIANGTYWIVGRACKTTASTATEIAYVPQTPIKITVSSGTGTVVVA